MDSQEKCHRGQDSTLRLVEAEFLRELRQNLNPDLASPSWVKAEL